MWNLADILMQRDKGPLGVILTVLLIVTILVVVVFFLLFLKFFRLWLQAKLSRADVKFSELIVEGKRTTSYYYEKLGG